MERSDFEVIFAALQRANVRYLVVGGVAVVLHGHPRFTADLDLVIALEAANVLAAMHALSELGYRPRAPVSAEAFEVPVASIADLIELKRRAGRPKDLEDIRALSALEDT